MNLIARSVNMMVRRYARQPGDVLAAQERALKRILAHSHDSAIARDMGFDRADSLYEYMSRTAVTHYPDLKPYWERAANGEEDVIGDEEIVHFAMTAGTTGDRKLVPINNSLLRNTRRQLMQIFSIYLARNPNSSALLKSGLAVTGRSRIEETPAGIPCGMISGISIERTHRLIKARGVPSMGTLNVENWDTKLELMADEASKRTIGYVAGIPGSIVSFFETAKETLPRSEYERMCSGIEVILTSGVNYRPYRQKTASLLGHEPEYVNVYMASEGMLGYESPEARDEFELFAGEMVFGFIPHEQYLEGDYSRRLRLDQLTEGVDYAILLTNGSGAFNYALGDVLTCTKADGVPRFKLAGRSILTLDVVAEKTSISAVEQTFSETASSLNITAGEFFVTTNVTGSRPHYVWVIENTGDWGRIPLEELSCRLDNTLRIHSKNYEYFTRLQPQVDPSRINLVTPKQFTDWLAARGGELGHRKIPRIIPDSSQAAALISAAG